MSVSSGTARALDSSPPRCRPYGRIVPRSVRVVVQVLAAVLVLALVSAVLVGTYLWTILFGFALSSPTRSGRAYVDVGVLLLPLVVVPPIVAAALRPVLPRDVGHAALGLGWLVLLLTAVPVLSLTLPTSAPPGHGSVSFRTGAALWGTHVVAAAALSSIGVVLGRRPARTRRLLAVAIGFVPVGFLALLWLTDTRGA